MAHLIQRMLQVHLPFKEVVHIVPVHTANFEMLFKIVKDVILGLEKLGFKVICVITDNNAINRKAMSFFAIPHKLSFVYHHPNSSNRPLFFLTDSVHIFKNITNNWINKKDQDMCLIYPDFEEEFLSRTASFSAIKKLYETENNSFISFSYGLTFKSIAPTNLEHQNVKLVLKIFNSFVIQGLNEVGLSQIIKYHSDTANFISIICKWWDIMNVKTPYKRLHKNNPFTKPLTVENMDGNFVFLDKWHQIERPSSGLSSETHSALKQTAYGMMELCQYCIKELNFKYILPGKFQTDLLEKRSGKYRRLAGTQYHISMRRVFECEKKTVVAIESVVTT